MSINVSDLENVVIHPTLEQMDAYLPGVYSMNAVDLLLGTIAQESRMGYHLIQRGAPLDIGAKGIYQIESKTHMDVWNNFLRYNEDLALFVESKASQRALEQIHTILPSVDSIRPWMNKAYNLENSVELDQNLISNLTYATVIARLIYWRDSEPMPHNEDLPAMAKYYKRVYNTKHGKATEEEFINNYKRYVLGEK